MPLVPEFPVASPRPRRSLAFIASLVVLLVCLDHAVALPLPDLDTGSEPLANSGHLVVSEVVTGGVSASDEFIEIYNPTAAALPLEGLEVVYVTASGATITRKASWAVGAPVVPSGAHLLAANEAGIFAVLADVTYANGLSASGGSIALRIQGAASAIDAVGWGTAASTWLEMRPAPAPAAGSSLERLPGGPAGSTQDIDDNLADFAIRPVPDPQNSVSEAVPGPTATSSPSPPDSVSDAPTPSGDPTPSEAATVTPDPIPTDTFLMTASPSSTPTATPTATSTPAPTPSPTPAPIMIGAAR
ncbi:MAG: lamin tail domain-containing protein, partial [Chloroflexota bacterium]|nr:lamin tail domain-containing protein [Chloroflexota bacterium]